MSENDNLTEKKTALMRNIAEIKSALSKFKMEDEPDAYGYDMKFLAKQNLERFRTELAYVIILLKNETPKDVKSIRRMERLRKKEAELRRPRGDTSVLHQYSEVGRKLRLLESKWRRDKRRRRLVKRVLKEVGI